MKLDYLQINILALTIYLFSLSLEKIFDAAFLFNISGLFLLFIATPLAFFQLCPLPSFSLLEKYFAFLVFYFFIYTPTFFFLNQLFGVFISTENILIVNLIIFSLALIKTRLHAGETLSINPKQLFNKTNRPILLALAGYIILHVTNYYFYRFIPEWDGYTDLVKIGNDVKSGEIGQIYRGFFYTASDILAVFSRIEPYTIFTIFFIGLQTSLLLVLYRLIRIFKINNLAIEATLYLVALSIPVINMEVDMTRPQNVVIIFLPILIYFLFQYSQERKSAYLILSALIGIFGINYHEFFIFPLLVYIGWLAFFIAKKTLNKSDGAKNQIIYSLLLLCFFLASVVAIEKLNILQSIINTAQNIGKDILNISQWKLWFLGNYSSDGTNLQMGWPGIGGAAKYYAYYLSPILAFIMGVFVYFFIIKAPLYKQALLRIILPLFLVLFIFSEILPRLNHLYLPERFWLLMDILIIIAMVPIIKFVSTQYPKIIKLFLIILILSCVSILGSFYVAINKKALTSDNEYRAALWIKKNTPENAFFITQSANGPMLHFFAHRTTVPVSSEYFLSDKILEQDPETEIIKLRKYHEKRIKEANSYVELYTTNKISFPEFSDKIQEEKILIKKIEREIATWEKLVDQSKYVVYSFDKFNTIYKEREWWMSANAYGANLEKFNKAYTLVYADGGVYIWKIR